MLEALPGRRLGSTTPLPTDTNPVANQIVLYSDTSGNKKSLSGVGTGVGTLGGYQLQTKSIHFLASIWQAFGF